MKNLETLAQSHFIENIKHAVNNGLWGKTFLMCVVEFCPIAGTSTDLFWNKLLYFWSHKENNF